MRSLQTFVRGVDSVPFSMNPDPVARCGRRACSTARARGAAAPHSPLRPPPPWSRPHYLPRTRTRGASALPRPPIRVVGRRRARREGLSGGVGGRREEARVPLRSGEDVRRQGRRRGGAARGVARLRRGARRRAGGRGAGRRRDEGAEGGGTTRRITVRGPTTATTTTHTHTHPLAHRPPSPARGAGSVARMSGGAARSRLLFAYRGPPPAPESAPARPARPARPRWCRRWSVTRVGEGAGAARGDGAFCCAHTTRVTRTHARTHTTTTTRPFSEASAVAWAAWSGSSTTKTGRLTRHRAVRPAASPLPQAFPCR